MYLAQKKIARTVHYYIRETYQGKGCLRSRDILYLGTDPAGYILYPGGNSFYIDERLVEGIRAQGAHVDYDEIEKMFWPFLDPAIRRFHERFFFRAREKARFSKKEEERVSAEVHVLDKRRLFYLKCGQMDLAAIRRFPPRYFRVLLGKSRDEIEQLFMKMELDLKPAEWKKYNYAIFNLQKFFPETWAKALPQGLDQVKIDERFLEEICRLHRDRSFWAGLKKGPVLHPYLVRYVVKFFDSDYGPNSYQDDYLRDFINRRRAFRPPPVKGTIKIKEAGAIFGVPEDELRKMNKRELTRLYRQKAKELHPDQGGDHEKFIELSETYAELLRRR